MKIGNGFKQMLKDKFHQDVYSRMDAKENMMRRNS